MPQEAGEAALRGDEAVRGPAVCELCGVTMTSHAQLEQHRAGKSHKYRTEEAADAARTVHLSGYPADTPAAALEAALASFGPVARLSLHPTFAFATFISPDSRQRAVDAGAAAIPPSSVVTIRPARVGTPASRNKTTGGGGVHVDRRSATQRVAEACAAVRSVIVPVARQPDDADAADGGAGSAPGGRHVCVAAQLEAVVALRAVDERELAARVGVVDAVRELVQAALADGMAVAPYGSAAVGLGEKGSDVDITVVGGVACADAHMALAKAACEDPRFASHGVVGTKCPVLVLDHLPTRHRVEVSINNILALRNSELQRTYVALHPIVSLLVHTARAWFETLPMRVSGYATTLLVIAYLQSVGALPNLQQQRCSECENCTTQRKYDSLTSQATCSTDDAVSSTTRDTKRRKGNTSADYFVIEGWDTFFCAPVSRPTSPVSAVSVGLVAGFFEFLSARCTGDAAVSVRCGGLLLAESCCCEQTRLTVEDPFELSHNVTRHITDKQCVALMRAAARAAVCVRDVVGLQSLFSPDDRSALDSFEGSAGGINSSPGSASTRCDRSEWTVSVNLKESDWSAANLMSIVIAVLQTTGVAPVTVDHSLCVVHGFVWRNTWVGSRRARRAAARMQGKQASAEDVTATRHDTIGGARGDEPSEVPLFHFGVYVPVGGVSGCGSILIRTHSVADAFTTAQQFCAVVKQRVLSSIINKR